ncbi:MAG: amino acid aminotransferase [Rubrivivax sp.]
MFETLQPAPPDKILSLMGLFRGDPRRYKIDLGVGVYRDLEGRTPIMAAVREAERRLHSTETTKSYLGPGGDPDYCDLVARLVFADDAPRARLRAAQTPGGAGALRILCGLIARARPDATVWVPVPTWVNHLAILADAGLSVRTHKYLDAAGHDVDFEAMMGGLQGMTAGDIVLLHGCCHNPSGASLDKAQWDALCDLLEQRGAIPFVDLAYQGFGLGLEDDAYAARLFTRRLPEVLVAVSNSKNFGIYRERTGAAFVLAAGASSADAAHSHLLVAARNSYSMPPDHGGALVRIVLSDTALRAQWLVELEAMRTRVVGVRRALAEAFAGAAGSPRYDFLSRHHGMFSLLGIRAEQARRLRDEHAVYIVEDGRINLAGLHPDQIATFVGAVLAVTR